MSENQKWIMQGDALVEVTIGTHTFTVDPHLELGILEGRLAKHCDEGGQICGVEWAAEIVEHLEREHGIRVGQIAAASYYYKIIAEHGRILDLFFPKLIPDGMQRASRRIDTFPNR
jgi:hypothetical protein